MWPSYRTLTPRLHTCAPAPLLSDVALAALVLLLVAHSCAADSAAVGADGSTTAAAVDALEATVAALRAKLAEETQQNDILSKHFERRLSRLRDDVEDLNTRLQAQLAATEAAEDRVQTLQAQLEAAHASGSADAAEDTSSSNSNKSSNSSSSDSGGDSDSSSCDCTCGCDCEVDCGVPEPDPAHVADHKLKEEIDRLFQVERARQRRVQHEDADSADNGPKEISIHCPQQPHVNIVDLSTSARDQNECMYVVVLEPYSHTRSMLTMLLLLHPSGCSTFKAVICPRGLCCSAMAPPAVPRAKGVAGMPCSWLLSLVFQTILL